MLSFFLLLIRKVHYMNLKERILFIKVDKIFIEWSINKIFQLNNHYMSYLLFYSKALLICDV